jgi:hypothetical protein
MPHADDMPEDSALLRSGGAACLVAVGRVGALAMLALWAIVLAPRVARAQGEPAGEDAEAPVDPPQADPAADRPTADLVYDVGALEGCPDAASFEDLVAARLGYDPFVTGSARLLSVKIDERGGGLVGTVWLEDDRGDPRRRSIEAGLSECESLATALATAVGIALDPLFHEAPPPAPSPQPKMPPVTAPEPPPDRRPTPPPPPRDEGESLRFRAFAGPTTSFGLAPGPTLGAALAAGIRAPAFSVVVEGRLDTLPSTAQLDSGDVVRALSITAGPTGCWHIAWWMGCVSGQLGAFDAEAEDIVDPEPSSTFSAKIGAATGAEIELSRQLALRAVAELGVPLVRTSLKIDDIPVWTAPPVHANLGVMAVLGLP